MKILIVIFSIFISTQDSVDYYSFDGIKVSMTINEFMNICKNEKKPIIAAMRKDVNRICGNLFKVYEGPSFSSKVLYEVVPYFNKESINIEFAVNNSNACTVGQIYVFSNDFKTREGIVTGNTLGDLKSTYTLKEFVTEKACIANSGRIVEEEKVGIKVEETKLVFYLEQSKIPRSWRKNPTLDGLSNDLKIYMICIL